MHEALYYLQKEVGVHCRLCPRSCRLINGETGLCGVKKEHQGKLYSLNYGLCAALAMDPVEKKPLYHFHPGREIFSIGTYGCNLSCGFCQNWHLAGEAPDADLVRFSPTELADLLDKQSARKPLGIAYTYSEPGMWYEYVLDVAQIVRDRGFKNVMVTNGFLNPEPLRELLPLIDAFNIDVKSFQDEYYQRYCEGRLKPVLRYVESAAEQTHVEITYLVVPSLNDSEDEIRRFANWVASINPAIPVHFARYFPQHRFTLPPVSIAAMEKLRKIARETLQYVYLGNIPGSDAAHTFCPGCGKEQVMREGYRTLILFKNKVCSHCGRPADFIL